MPTYTVNAINVGSFNLGEADKLLTIFCAERGLHKVVAKGARKPGAKIAGRAELLNINTLFIASGRSLDIISQAETIETFSGLRKDLTRLTFALYYAELTQHFGQGLSDESSTYFDYLRQALRLQSEAKFDSEWLCLKFEIGLLSLLGYKPEITCCVSCRAVLSDYLLGVFNIEWGGIICKNCLSNISHLSTRLSKQQAVYREQNAYGKTAYEITPLVWKHLVLAASDEEISSQFLTNALSSALKQSLKAARRLIQTYIEHKAGKSMKSLTLVAN